MRDLQKRFEKQIEFLIEVDKVKNIFRQTRTISSKRFENDAEHGWHMCLMALILSEYSNQIIDIVKVVKMALIHDLVEIDIGDTFLYSEKQENKYRDECKCANRIFGILPEDQREEYLNLWKEFEEKRTSEAKFAGALDRLGPVMQNYFDNGYAWKKHNVKRDSVLRVNKQIENGSIRIWDYAKSIIEKSIEKGFLEKEQE